MESLKKYGKVVFYLLAFFCFLFLLIFSIQEIRNKKGVKSFTKDHISIGDELFNKGDYISALTAYGYASKFLPNDPEINKKIIKSRLYLVSERPDLVANANIEDLLHETRYMLKEDEKNKAVYVATEGQLLFIRGDEEGAKVKFKNALDIDRNNIGAHIGLALLNSKDNENINEAVREVKSILEVKPDHIYALILLSSLYLRMKDNDKSIEIGEKALAKGENYNIRLILGRAYSRKGDNKEAEKHLLRARELNPQSFDPNLDLSDIYFSQQKFADAEREIRIAMAKQNQLQNDVNTLFRLGLSMSRQGRFREAINILEQLYNANPQNYNIILETAVAYEGGNQTDKALNLYKQFATLQPPTDENLKNWFEQVLPQVKTKIQQIESKPSH